MATTTLRDTALAPRLALGVVLAGTSAGQASVSDVAAALNVLTALIGDEDDAPLLAVTDVNTGPIRALAVVEHDGAPLIISAGEDGALRSWHLDSTRGELEIRKVPTGSIWALAVVKHAGSTLIIGASVSGAVELFAYADRRPGSPFGRAFHAVGREIQRLVSTREPTPEQLEVGRAALAEILRAEGVAD